MFACVPALTPSLARPQSMGIIPTFGISVPGAGGNY